MFFTACLLISHCIVRVCSFLSLYVCVHFMYTVFYRVMPFGVINDDDDDDDDDIKANL